MKTFSTSVALLCALLLVSGTAVSGRKLQSPSTRHLLSNPKCCDELAHLGFESSDPDYSCAAVKMDSKCKDDMSWEESKEACESIGARLCHWDELEDEVLLGLGCGNGLDVTWTDERCVSNFMTGENGYLAYSEDGLEQWCLSKDNEKAQLACCADPCESSHSVDDVSDSALSTKSCAELRKKYPFHYKGDDTVCATAMMQQADGDFVCGEDVSFESAKMMCEDIGARLCTYEEFQLDELISIGCDLNTHLTWSSEPCVSDYMTGETGYLAAETDGGRDATCLPKTKGSARMACCADKRSASKFIEE